MTKPVAVKEKWKSKKNENNTFDYSKEFSTCNTCFFF